LENQASYTNNKNDNFNKLCAILENDMLIWEFLYDNRNLRFGDRDSHKILNVDKKGFNG
jgi:hypothetical protein